MSDFVPAPSTPAGGDTPSSVSSPTPSSSAPAAITPVSSAPTPAAPPSEDRSNWIPPYRLKEAQTAAYRRAQEEFGSQHQATQSELAAVRRQLQALVGASPQSPQTVEQDAIRQQFGQLFPGLSKLEEKAAALDALLGRSADLESQNEHYWQSYGRQQVDRLFSKASEAIGVPLTDEGKRFLHQSFVGYVQSSPDLTERYASDPTLVDDYLKVFASNIIDPSRRQNAAAIQARVPGQLPQDGPSGALRSAGAPEAFKGLDDRSAAAWAMFNSPKAQQG